MLSKGWQWLTGLLLLGAQGGGARARQAAGRGFLWEVGSCQGLGAGGSGWRRSAHRPSAGEGRLGGALPCPCCPWNSNLPPCAALKSSPSKKGRGALLAVKPLGPTAAFSASQIPSEREDAQYDLRGARSYPTLEDEGDRLQDRAHSGGGGGGREAAVPGARGEQQPCTSRTSPLKLGQARREGLG